MTRPPSAQQAWINHYYYKSLEDYLERGERERTATQDRSALRKKEPKRQKTRGLAAMAEANEVIDTCAIDYFEAHRRWLEERLSMQSVS